MVAMQLFTKQDYEQHRADGGTCPLTMPSNLNLNDESDIEILSRQSSNCSSLYEDAYDKLDDEERLNELTLKEGIPKISL